MRNLRIAAFALMAGLFIAGAIQRSSAAVAQTTGCGGERSAIATLSDAGAGAVSLDPLAQQVVDLNNWPPPRYLDGSTRAGGVESHVYTVTAELLGSTLQPNGDFDMILGQPGDARWTVVAVLPDPARCAAAAASSAATDMQTARNDVASTIGLRSGGLPSAPTIIRVTGAGFFNPSPGGPGEALNGLELSPVIRFALAGPAVLTSFPVLAAGTSSMPTVSAVPASTATQTSAPAAPAASSVSGSQAAVSPAPPVATASAVAPVPDNFAASQQQISDALAANAPSSSELPSQFSSAILAAAGPGSGPSANAYDVDLLLLGSNGQPAATLTYLVFAGADDAQNASAALQAAVSQSGLTPQPVAGQTSGSFCAQSASTGGGAPCAIVAGSVLVLAQAGDQDTALAAAQAGIAHLTRLVPTSG